MKWKVWSYRSCFFVSGLAKACGGLEEAVSWSKFEGLFKEMLSLYSYEIFIGLKAVKILFQEDLSNFSTQQESGPKLTDVGHSSKIFQQKNTHKPMGCCLSVGEITGVFSQLPKLLSLTTWGPNPILWWFAPLRRVVNMSLQDVVNCMWRFALRTWSLSWINGVG